MKCLTPQSTFASSPFYVNTKLSDFPAGDTPRRAAVNSLGIGGTNAFAVLEEAPPIEATENKTKVNLPCLVTLSAKSAEALVAQVERLLKWLDDHPEAPIGDVCYTTNVSRSQFAFRFAAPGRSLADLKKHLANWLKTTVQRCFELAAHQRCADRFHVFRSGRAVGGHGCAAVSNAFRLSECHGPLPCPGAAAS